MAEKKYSIKELEDLMKHFKKYSEGGEVEPTEDEKEETRLPASDEDKHKVYVNFGTDEQDEAIEQAYNDTTPEGYADGGEVEDPQSLTPEEFEASLQKAKDEGMTVARADEEEPIDVMNDNIKESKDEPPVPTKAETVDKSEDEETPDKESDEDNSDEETKEEPQPEPIQPDDSSFARLVASVKPQQTPFDANKLAEAQRQRDMNLAMNQIEMGAALTGAAIPGKYTEMKMKMLQGQRGEAGMPVQKYEEQLGNQKNDPNSSMSQAYRSFYEKVMGKAPPPNWSAADLEKVSPLFEKYMQAQSSAQNRMLMKQMDIQSRMQQEQSRHEDRMLFLQDKKDRAVEIARHNKEMEGLRKDMVGLANSRLDLQRNKSVETDPTIKKANDRINSAETALNQLNDMSQPLTMNRLNAIQIDLASTLNFMAQQGASDYKAKSDKLETLKTRLAAIRQRYGSQIIDLRKVAPEVYKEVNDYAKSVQQSVHKIRDDQYKYLAKRYGTSVSERVQPEEKPKQQTKQKLDQSEMVTVRRKSDGATKTLSKDDAAKYLKDPGFEQL